ncbi:MAG: 4Fe-4S binding protein [Firmicutes bacterium]|nr:4Fe-4S binding protein [Bacillota bacterium]
MKWTLTADAAGRTCLMQGNEALVRGAVESGINYAASYPGSPSSQVLGMLGEIADERQFYAQWSVNETCALESCIGTSLTGARSLCIVKQNGLLTCADPLHCGALHGVKGGLVIISSDDPNAHSSTNELDSRFMAMSADIPMIEPITMQDAKDMVPYAYELSEKLGQMVIIRVTTRVCHGRGNVVLGELPEKNHGFTEVSEWERMCAASFLHQAAIDRLNNAKAEFENCPFNKYQGPEEPEMLIVASGTGHLYAKETVKRLGLEEKVGLLSLASLWPLPENFIMKRMKSAKKVLVLEEIDPFMERNIQSLAGKFGLSIEFHGKLTGSIPSVGELTPDGVIYSIKEFAGIPLSDTDIGFAEASLVGAKLPAHAKKDEKEPLLRRELAFCAGCPHRATFYLLKKALRLEKTPGIVIGDIGCYTLACQQTGFYAYQQTTCMGSGISAAQGIGQLTAYGMDQKVVSMAGDSTFFHSVIPGLLNASYHNSNMLMLVLDNSATAMTGFQPHPGLGITATGKQVAPMDITKICEALGCTVETTDPFDVEATAEKLHRLLQLPGLKVLIMKQPCATMTYKGNKEKRRVWVDQSKCLGDGCGCDKFCSRVWGCPGNSWDFKNNKAVIDTVSCVGCGVCAKLCPAGAIQVEGGEENA